jgi:uncharacterized coiled-coil protein SlyX
VLRLIAATALVTAAGVGWLIYRQEKLMATAAEQIDALTAKFDDLVADVRVVVAERENLTPAGQAAADRLASKLDSFDVEVGDADGSDTATPPTEDASPSV